MPKNIDLSRVMMFSDIHYGMRNNSREHNQCCEDFIKWAITRAKDLDIKTLLFLGDWSHHRNSINVSTLNYSHSGLKMLNDAFDDVIMLLGNHDLYFRDKLEIHSIPYAVDFTNIQLIDKITTFGDFCFVPWLVGDEWKQIPKIKKPYLFCHAEISKFQMNAMTLMPDHGGLGAEHFAKQQLVFSGHFHKRQRKGNILYIGNAFPHNYADAWDDDRGLVIWELGQDPQFLAWPEAPRYRTLSLSQVVGNPTHYIDNRTYAKITIDIDTSYEDINFIRELLERDLGAREVQMIAAKVDEQDKLDAADINFESVDTIVISHLQTIDSVAMDKNELIRIYQEI